MDDDAFSQSRKRLLVITRFCPLNGSSGAGTYLFSILRYLHQNGLLITVCWSERPEAATRRGWWIVPQEMDDLATLCLPGALNLGRLRLFPSVLLDPPRKAVRRVLKRSLLALGLGPLLGIRPPASAPADPSAPPVNPYQWDRPPGPYETAFFGRAIARFQPDALLFSYCWMNPIADQLAPSTHPLKLTLTQDLHHLYSTLENGTIHRGEGGLMSQAAECEYLRRSDAIIAIRQDDAEIFRSLLPDKTVLVANPSFSPLPPDPSPLPDRCLFVAADNLANREGIQWFLREAWPQLRAARPAAELHLCGTICSALPLPDPPGVVRRGWVDSLHAVYDEASVVIVPLLRGSGVKIKLMEALAHGKACVTTPIGTEGVPALDAQVCVAGTADAFAQGVVRLLGDASARQALETRAFETIRQQFCAETCYGPILEYIQKAPLTPASSNL